MSCVNRNTEEFKELVNSTGIHPDNIESIVYTLQSRNTDPNYYPTASEIREALKPRPIILDESTSKWFLDKGYTGPLIFKNYNDVMRKLEELNEYFSPEQIITYKKTNGDYVVELGGVNNNTLLKDVLSTTGDFLNYTLQERLQNQVTQESIEEVLPYESTLLNEFIDKTLDKRSYINFYPLKDKNSYRLHIPYSMSLSDALTHAPKYLERELGSEKAALLTLGKEIKTSVDGKYKYLTLNIKGKGRQKRIEKTKAEKTQRELEEERVYNEKLAQIYEVAPHLKYKVEAGLIDGRELINNEDSITQYGAEPIIDSRSQDKDTTEEFQVESVATKFTVSNSNSYPARTRENVILSDVTIALAQDFTTAGERLTKKEALKENKYIKADLSANTNNATEIANNIYEQLKTKGKLTNLKINIAGNGIYSMSQSQSYYNDLVTQVLKELQARGVTIAEIRSGGQTGIDEAGIIAAQRLGIPSEVHTTADFKFRDKNNIDIADEKLFKERFSISNLETTEILEKTEDIELQNETSINQDKVFVDKSTKVTQQIDNLNSSSLLTASEVRHVARQIVWSISDHITDLMEKPGYAEQIYGERLKDKDLSKMSRAEVAKLIGADNLIDRAKELFHPEKANYEDLGTMDKAEEIYYNWDALMLLASSEFLNTEKFSMTSVDNNVYEVNEDLNADADNINISQREMDILESEGNLQEHWQIETKTLDVLDTMSQKVRQALMGCYILDKEGNPVTSEFGIKERVDVREATNSILRWGQGALSLSQLISKLKEKEKSQPWVKQIIERLSDDSGRESDLKSQFWGTFCKHFQPYSIVTVDKKTGKYKSMIVNENPALKEAIDQVITEYNIGEHPLFTSEGINSKSFEDLKEAFQELWKFNTKDTDFSSKDTIEEISNTLGYISNLFGYYVTPQMVENIIDGNTFKKMYSALNYIMKSLEQNLNNRTYDPFKFDAKEGVKGNIMQFLKPITDQLEDTSVAAFYDSGKMYQSYITPSYTTKLFKKFGLEGKEFDDFITKEYGNFDWFHTGTNIERGWRNVWLQTLVLNENARKVFKHKVQLNFNKSNYMKTMDDMEYTVSLITEYLSGETINGRTTAWFRVPMLSNKPSSEFIRFYSEREDNYKRVLTDGFKKIFDQELSRIQTVEMRNLGKKDPGFIKNFDTNGRKFCFLDFMNEYLNGAKKSSELGQLIRQKLNGERINEARLNELALEAIKNSIQSKVNNIISNWEKQGIINGLKKVKGIGATKEEIRNTLENFIWNDTFAAMNIMQLTITDIAYYKDAEDFQKRLAQIHAPGIRGDIYATDYNSNKVSDGFYRTIKLKDFDDFKSNIIDNVSIVFDRKIEAAKTEEEKKGLKALKESLVGKEGAFRKINVADAQGYSSPTSYRKKAFMFGKWSKEAEEVYKKLREGTYNYRDLQVAFQPLKPFVYSQIVENSNAEKAPLSTLKVPIQFKNSEYLLIMADALLQGENTGKPNLLRAIFKTMERSHFNDKDKYKADGIDTIQFESTTKSGLSGAISLNDLVNDPNGETIALARLNAAIYKENGSYNENTVDIVPMEDYCLQQEIPEHFKEHEQMHGSQLRYIIPSELESSEGITYKTEKGEVSAQEFKQEYERTIAENIEEDLTNLENKLALNSLSIRDRNIALSKILQREILSSPRYGVDLLQACSIDKNGNFRIPLGDPIQSKRVEQLINSIIKNSVNKQEIPGGPVVQVSNFGTSKELNIRFKNKNKEGELLDLRKDYKGTDEEYKNYIKENQGGIAYFEVFAPIYTNNLFTKFADKNGIINIKAIEILEPDLLKMIGYRI
jgi:hypothetical protein